eukprot:scaffold51333_cov27-Tisochrysis_lutea.AAC.8
MRAGLTGRVRSRGFSTHGIQAASTVAIAVGAFRNVAYRANGHARSVTCKAVCMAKKSTS